MNTMLIHIAFGTIYCLEQFSIGLYGWRNPRPSLNILRKILSGIMFVWALTSTYRVVTLNTADFDQFVASYGMTMYVVANCLTVALLGAVLFIVRKKYFLRVRERSQTTSG